MENGQKTLDDLFEGKKIFKIPEYQRAYAWEKKQLIDFMDDLSNQKPNKSYFMGTILFQELGKRGLFEVIEIVDGQQRITTLVIFVKQLLDMLNLDKENLVIYFETFIKYRSEYKLEILEQDNEFFKTYILENNKIFDSLISTPSQKRLIEAKEFFKQELSGLEQEALLSLMDKVSKTKVLTYSVVDKAEATLIFETTNDRGKTLTNLEKTKSFLMYKTYLLSAEPESKLHDIQARFSQMYKEYSTIEDRIDENSVLQYHFIAFEKWISTKENKEYQKYMTIVKNRINKLIEQEENSEALLFIDKYSRELRESFALTTELLHSSIPEFNDISILGRIANFYPLLIKTYKYDDTSDKRNFRLIARLIEIFSFRVYGIGKALPYAGATRFFALARDFGGDYVKLASEIKSTIEQYTSLSDFLKKLESPSFYRDYSPIVKNYFYWKYENYLRKHEQPVAHEVSCSDYLSKDKRTKFSIEHISPQNPGVKDSKVITKALKTSKITTSFVEKYLHCIGNLTIDPASANSSKQNAEFQVKENRYFVKAPFKAQNELSDFLDNDKWTHVSIEKRMEKLLGFAARQWEYS